ncbi:MAG TPA: hypothetical protein VGY13_14175 [Solirubrobacteraceae bacterium]|nr:hypothetical protein [Solirubrobacteraceae bacterium]
MRSLGMRGATFTALTILSAAGAYLAATPAAGTAADAGGEVGGPAARSSLAAVYFTSFAGGFDPPSVTLKMRPRAIQMSGDASWIIGPIRWTSWGGAIAKGSGPSDVETCEPNCASGGIVKTTSQVTLSTLGSFDGRRVYRCISVSSHGGSSFARRRAAVTHYCPL